MKEFKKITEWDVSVWNGKSIRDNHVLLIGFIFMIPILGQITWLFLLGLTLNSRKIYFQEVHKR